MSPRCHTKSRTTEEDESDDSEGSLNEEPRGSFFTAFVSRLISGKSSIFDVFSHAYVNRKQTR